jgi:hypothetical protein
VQALFQFQIENCWTISKTDCYPTTTGRAPSLAYQGQQSFLARHCCLRPASNYAPTVATAAACRLQRGRRASKAARNCHRQQIENGMIHAILVHKESDHNAQHQSGATSVRQPYHTAQSVYRMPRRCLPPQPSPPRSPNPPRTADCHDGQRQTRCLMALQHAADHARVDPRRKSDALDGILVEIELLQVAAIVMKRSERHPYMTRRVKAPGQGGPSTKPYACGWLRGMADRNGMHSRRILADQIRVNPPNPRSIPTLISTRSSDCGTG